MIEVADFLSLSVNVPPSNAVFSSSTLDAKHLPTGRASVLFGGLYKVLDHKERGADAENIQREESFDVLFDILDNTDKKLLIKELIEKIELYPRLNRSQSGQWIKTIHFKFPMFYNDNNKPDCAVRFDRDGHFLPNGSTDESIVCLVRE